jgi:trimeric autotransporter adhesin
MDVRDAVMGSNWPVSPKVPGAPTIGTVTAGNAQATVPFTAPASDGGSAITGYRVTSSPGGITATGLSSPIVITGLSNGTAYTFTVAAQNIVGYGPESAASNSVTPSAYAPSILAQVYNSSNTSASTGSFTVPAGTNFIYVFGAAGGGSGGLTVSQDNGSGAGGGGAANVTGYKIAVSSGDTISYSVGAGGAGRNPSSGSNNGITGSATTLTRSGSDIFNLSAGVGGGQDGGSGGSGGANNGYGVSGGSGGTGGQRSSFPGGNGTSRTNGCGGGGGGGAHVSNKTGGTGGASTITAGTSTFGAITIAFIGSSGGAAGTPQSSGNAPPENISLAFGGYGTAQDGNTGAGGGAGAGIKPVVNGTATTHFHGGGGGGYRSYITSTNTTAYDGRAGGGFLIVVASDV